MKRSLNNILLSTYLLLTAAAAFALPPVIVTGVSTNTDSFKVQYQAVPNAGDYRIADVTTPTHVKYAGAIHTLVNGKIVTVPGLEIEQNGVTPGVSHTYIIEATDRMGPAPEGNLYDAKSAALHPSMDTMGMVGSNMGPTDDGMVSTNGQGASIAIPTVIARSVPFSVTCFGVPRIVNGKTSVFDTFTTATITPIGTRKRTDRLWTYDMTTDTGNAWDVGQLDCDNANTSVFVMGRHLMDIEFDGGTPATGNPQHTQHGVVVFSPKQSADISATGSILHVTMEVDAHLDSGRRWLGISLASADDPLKDWYGGHPVNKSNTAAFVQIQDGLVSVGQYTGFDAAGKMQHVSIFGAVGQAPHNDCRKTNGRGLDNRSRFDLFVSTSHFAFYEDGGKVCEGDWARPLPFADTKVYFTHYVYHTALERNELMKSRPYETYWIDVMPFSDERHWDDMGFEVLPAGTAFGSVAAFALPAVFVKP